ncbi:MULTISPECIES: hypothetical protein [unclassified Streptomyces]|uniref:hypothetical protein n=1 Tax=unclassified Streptomyces TaxID=2593676 RepID=UPI0022562E15|nr:MULTISPECIES: hypothetical protein [unclassified Streptomyces]MCX4529426.1 hypothetical protein [Streptomyces sp. NBC_01551]MCX4540034.1 hypothetical protein [Streptomyces sp. NBC_01565]
MSFSGLRSICVARQDAPTSTGVPPADSAAARAARRAARDSVPGRGRVGDGAAVRARDGLRPVRDLLAERSPGTAGGGRAQPDLAALADAEVESLERFGQIDDRRDVLVDDDHEVVRQVLLAQHPDRNVARPGQDPHPGPARDEGGAQQQPATRLVSVRGELLEQLRPDRGGQIAPPLAELRRERVEHRGQGPAGGRLAQYGDDAGVDARHPELHRALDQGLDGGAGEGGAQGLDQALVEDGATARRERAVDQRVRPAAVDAEEAQALGRQHPLVGDEVVEGHRRQQPQPVQPLRQHVVDAAGLRQSAVQLRDVLGP